MALVDVEAYLREIAPDHGFQHFNLQIESISSEGANYSSTLYKAKIEDKDNVAHVFIKMAIVSPGAMADLGVSDVAVYEGERYFYSNVTPFLKEIEEKHNLSEINKYVLPKYYGGNGKTLVLEDLGEKGFTTFDRFKSIEWVYASKSVTQLAKFHALAMAFKKEQPDAYKEFTDKCAVEVFNEKLFDLMFKPSFKTSVAAVSDQNRERVEKFLNNIQYADIHDMYLSARKKILIHSDFRPSNLMHRYTESGKLEVIPIDYQTFQEGSPVVDLLYFVFTGSDADFRRRHFDQLMEHYYTELSAAMARLGVDHDAYTKEDFDHDLKQKLKYGLVMAATVLPFVTVEPADAPSLTQDFAKFTQFKTSDKLQERLGGVVDDYIRWGII